MTKIYISVYDDIGEGEALYYASAYAKVSPAEGAVVRWSNGICVKKLKGTKSPRIHLWREPIETEQEES